MCRFKKAKTWFVYVVIIVLQLLVMLYWGAKKQNYHIDEFFTMGYTSAFTGEGDIAQYIIDGPEWKYNEWVENSELKKYMEISEEEQLVNLSFTDAWEKALSQRNYFALLNILHSIEGSSKITEKSSIILNIVLFIIAEITLLSLMKKLDFAEWIKILSLAMFGFSGYIISCVIYIRFYMLVIMLLLLMLNLFWTVWKSDSLKQIIPAEMGILILAYLQYKNTELIIAYLGIFLTVFIVACIWKRKWKQLIPGIVVGVLGIIYILTNTSYVSQILNAGKTEKPSRFLGAVYDLINPSLTDIAEHIKSVTEICNNYYFGHLNVILLVILFLTVFSVKKCKGNKEILPQSISIKPSMLFATAVWFTMLVYSCFLGKGVIISLFVLLLLYICVILEMLGIKIELKKFFCDEKNVFVSILLGTMIFYTLFLAMTDLITWRYWCYGFISFVMVFWYTIDRLLKTSRMQYLKKGWQRILALFVIVAFFATFQCKNVANLYEGDEYLKYQVMPYRDCDVILVVAVESYDDMPSMPNTYDCVNQMSENAKIYAINGNAYCYENVDFSEEFLLWGKIDRDVTLIIKDLEAHGYTVESLGTNEHSQVYLCKVQ